MNDTEKLITAMGMMAENMQRQAIGESMAYPEIAFQELLKDHKCGGLDYKVNRNNILSKCVAIINK
jgi:hypothetical protein